MVYALAYMILPQLYLERTQNHTFKFIKYYVLILAYKYNTVTIIDTKI